VSDLVEERLWLTPRYAHIDQRSDKTNERPMKDKTRFDAPAHPHRKDERHHCGGDKNGRQKGALPKEVEHGKNDGEDEQLRQEPSDQYAPPPQLCGFHTRRILVENHVAPNAVYFLHYNFARIHRTLRVTPAMAAGIADHAWSIEEIVALLDTRRAVAA
jgi:hypothetical protein